MKKIPLTRGLFALVDDEDYEWLTQWKWHARRKSESARVDAGATVRSDRGPRCLLMHRVVVAAPAGAVVDHINGDPLDNRKANLRVCKTGENSCNRPSVRGNTTGFKGVCSSRYGSFVAQIQWKKRNHHLGTFATPEEAARAYDAAALKYHGEFAYLNFPQPKTKPWPHQPNTNTSNSGNTPATTPGPPGANTTASPGITVRATC